MRLFEHPDFEQAIIHAAEHLGDRGLRPAIIEKDYMTPSAACTFRRAILARHGKTLSYKLGKSA